MPPFARRVEWCTRAVVTCVDNSSRRQKSAHNIVVSWLQGGSCRGWVISDTCRWYFYLCECAWWTVFVVNTAVLGATMKCTASERAMYHRGLSSMRRYVRVWIECSGARRKSGFIVICLRRSNVSIYQNIGCRKQVRMFFPSKRLKCQLFRLRFTRGTAALSEIWRTIYFGEACVKDCHAFNQKSRV